MKHLDEYRDPERIRSALGALEKTMTRPWTVMEVCGGQTHAIVRFGLDQLLPSGLELIHGPGCPVCVTDTPYIDHAINLARTSGITLCSFGDMLRVPGSDGDLLQARADGGLVEVVYSPMEALALAEREPNQEVVFFAVGFETTAPTTAMAVYEASRRNVNNFSIINAHVRVPPALEAILASEETQVQGFLAAGHVCTIMGTSEYEPIAANHHVPIVVTGFEPFDLLRGLYRCIAQLEDGVARVENEYSRIVQPQGNPTARKLMQRIYEIQDRTWRGLGIIPGGGFDLSDEYRSYDALRKFDAQPSRPACASRCQAGQVLRGLMRPRECPEFGRTCTPDTPLGAPMVSSEGACAAYFNYREQA